MSRRFDTSDMSEAAWQLLTLTEQQILHAIDDFERGRFDFRELRDRVAGLRKAQHLRRAPLPASSAAAREESGAR